MDALTWWDVAALVLVGAGLAALVLQLVGEDRRTAALQWVQTHVWVCVSSVALVGVASWLLLR